MIRAASPSEVAWVCARLPIPYSQAMRGVTNGLAMVVFDGWTPNSVQVHVHSLSPRGLFDSSFLQEVFRYAFDQCGKSIVYSVTPDNNEASIRLSRALGFKEVYRMRDGWSDGVDMVVKELRRKDCKYLRLH